MAVTPTNLLDPEGPLQPHMFPADVEAGGTTLTDRLQGYIDKGVSLTSGTLSGSEQDRAVYWYSLYRGWDAVYSMMITRPARITQEGAETTEYTKEQIEAVREARDEALRNYEGIVATVTSAVREAFPATQSVVNQFVM